jgi:HEAT repeat protein
VEQRLSDENREVRASAVEGLWGVNTPGARAILREAACDLHYRVMANALVGLSLLDGTSAPLEEMVRHPASPFRAAAALSMGRTLDELFVPLLNSMVKDVNAEVRSAVLRSLVAIRRKAAQPPVPEASASPVEAGSRRHPEAFIEKTDRGPE